MTRPDPGKPLEIVEGRASDGQSVMQVTAKAKWAVILKIGAIVFPFFLAFEGYTFIQQTEISNTQTEIKTQLNSFSEELDELKIETKAFMKEPRYTEKIADAKNAARDAILISQVKEMIRDAIDDLRKEIF